MITLQVLMPEKTSSIMRKEDFVRIGLPLVDGRVDIEVERIHEDVGLLVNAFLRLLVYSDAFDFYLTENKKCIVFERKIF